MSTHPKSKRTKEEILRLLERAMEMEEQQAQRIQELETELVQCRKKAENPRAEFAEAPRSSKVGFRIDYYYTAKSSPLKGIIEHLPSRQTLSFHGNGFEEIEQFVEQFLQVKAPEKRSKSPKVVIASPRFPPDIREEPLPELEKKTEISPLLRRILPELFPKDPREASTPFPGTAKQIQADSFSIVEENGRDHRGSITANAQFHLEIPMKELDAFVDKECVARIKVEAVENGQSFVLTEHYIPRDRNLLVPQKPLTLQHKGAYRLTARLSLTSDARHPYYRESRLLVVH